MPTYELESVSRSLHVIAITEKAITAKIKVLL